MTSSPTPVPVFAILMIVTACLTLAGMDVIAKYLALGLPVLQVLWGRYFFHTVLTFGLYAAKRRNLGFLVARRPRLQFIRAVAMFGATSFFYVAITRMPLGDASAIQFMAPVIVTILSGFFLGETVGRRRILGVVVAFVGVLLVARPGTGVLGWDALLPAATALLLAIYMVLTRVLSDKDDPDATTFYSTALGAVVLSVIMFLEMDAMDGAQWGLMVLMGSAGALGHYLLVRAFHMAEASLLAPYTYAQVIGAIFWGFLVFGDIPSPLAAAGTVLIIGSGVYVWYRETYGNKD